VTKLKDDLIYLRRLKDEAEAVGREKKKADAKFKNHQRKCLDRMEVEEVDGQRSGGYLFTAVREKVYGQISDRSEFVKWALENDPELVTYKEVADPLNQLVRSRLDDKQPMPPGVTFRSEDVISMRKS